MTAWPPPACPGAGAALWQRLQELEPGEPLDFAELFAGKGAVHRALAALGFRGRRMDLSYDPGHDLLTPVGFLLAVQIALDLKPGGLMWLAPPCTTWVWMSRATTGRHIQVVGDVTSPPVVRSNALTERLALLLEILHLKNCRYIIEQPCSSCLWDYPALRDVLRRHRSGRCFLHMGAYGGTSLKPTTLMGTAPFLTQLARRCSPQQGLRLQLWGVRTTKKWRDGQGKKRCQGTGALKGTQAYPEGFGAAHALAFRRHFGRPAELQGPRPWARANLAALLEELPRQVKQGLPEAWYLRDFLGEPW